MNENHSNWAGNYLYRAQQIHQPETIEQVQEIVHRSDKLKALGTRHSFNDIADTSGDLIALKHFNKILELDRERGTVTVEAGIRYGELCRWLERQGFA
ncbi:MAG: FAD-binding oxidoreductase, partial [Byssovorax cruenta]